MARKRGRFGEIVMVLLILGVIGVIGFRFLRYREVQELSAGGGVDYNRPNLDQVQVTIPGRPHFIPDLVQAPDTIRRRVTFTLSTNSHGFRGREYTIAKPAGTHRIACVGECVTYGNGVDDGKEYPTLLQEMLDQRWPDRGYEVLNISQNVDPSDVFSLLKDTAVPTEPDVVVLSPGTDTVFFEEHTGGAPFRLTLDPTKYQRSLGAFRGQLRTALDLSRRHGFRLVLVTPTINTFFYPDGQRWVDEVKTFGEVNGIAVLDSAGLFQEREAQDGLVFQHGAETQQLVRYRGGKGKTLVEAASDPSYYVAPEVYAYLDDHPKVAPLLSIDENHPNPLGHELLAEELLRILEQGGLLEPAPAAPAASASPAIPPAAGPPPATGPPPTGVPPHPP